MKYLQSGRQKSDNKDCESGAATPRLFLGSNFVLSNFWDTLAFNIVLPL
jgi:hypothetical protein